MSFRGLAQGYDFSMLPKVTTHAQLGRMGDCSVLTPWDCLPTDVDQAEQELVNMRQWLLDFANGIARLRDDAVEAGAPQSVIDGFNQSLSEQTDLVQQFNGIMNQFYSTTGRTSVSGLLGLRQIHGLGSLGQGPLTLLELAPIIGTILGQLGRALMWVWVTKIIGTAAEGYKTNAEAAKTEAISRVDCYKLYREAVAAGKNPPSCATGEPTDWTTVALIGGSVALAFLLLQRR